MLIFIKSWITPPQDSPSKESLVEVQKAYRVENIKEVSEVNALTNPKGEVSLLHSISYRRKALLLLIRNKRRSRDGTGIRHHRSECD